MEPSTKSVISTQPSPVTFDFLTSIGQQMAAISMNQARPVAPLTSKLVSAVVIKPIIPDSAVDTSDQKKDAVKINVDLSLQDVTSPKKSEDMKEQRNGCNAATTPTGSVVEPGIVLLPNGHELLLQELELLRAENKSQREQLKLQSQVNNDLKKLLVASVGEDIEARVHFLTEDKVKLANDIRRYVEQLTVDFETKETLSVQADLWRSKYLAANVLVDELRQWKLALSRRCDQLQNCIRLLVDEHNKTRQMSLAAHKSLSTLLTAFVPKSASPPRPRSSNVLDVMQANHAATNVLREKLSGSIELQNGLQEYDDLCPNTNGERLALNRLDTKVRRKE